MGVRAAATITMGSFASLMFELLDDALYDSGHVAEPGGVGGDNIVFGFMRMARRHGRDAMRVRRLECFGMIDRHAEIAHAAVVHAVHPAVDSEVLAARPCVGD